MSEAASRKRRRPAKACEQCRHRKVRCDLRAPCGPCTRGKTLLDCLYRDGGGNNVNNSAIARDQRSDNEHLARTSPSHSRPRGIGIGIGGNPGLPTPTSTSTSTSTHDGSSTTTTTNLDLHQAIRDIHGRLNSLEQRLSDPKTVEASALRSTLHRELRTLTDRIDTIEGQLATRPDTGIDKNAGTLDLSRDPTSVGAMTPRLRSCAVKVKFLGPTHWCNKMDAFSFFEMLHRKDPEPCLGEIRNNTMHTIKECRELRQSMKSQRSVKFNDPFPDLRATVPERKVCDELVRCYMQTFESVYRVIHVPSFWAEYEEYWTQTQAQPQHPAASACSPFLVKLLLILAIGTVSHGHGAGARLNSPVEGADLQHIAQKWIYAAQWWVAGPSEKSTVNLDGLQVVCLLLIARKACGMGASPWLSGGSLMRMAVAMGLHRDPARFASLSVLQCEVRRRLWVTVLELGLQESLDSGTPVLVPPSCDTGAPSYVNDEDLSPSQTSPTPTPEHKDVVTDASVQLQLHDSFNLRLQVLSVIHNTKGHSYQEALDLGAKLRIAIRKSSAFFRSAKVSRSQSQSQHSNSTTTPELDPGPGLGLGLGVTDFAAGFLDTYLHRYMLALYTPFIAQPQTRKDPRYYYARKACLDSAARIASYVETLNLDPHSGEANDLQRLFVSGKGSFKGPLSLDILSALGLELITQLEEECPYPAPALPGINETQAQTQAQDPLDRVFNTNLDHLMHTLEHILSQLFHIISSGQPSMKRHGLLAAMIGQIQAVREGQDVKRTVYEAVSRSFRDCYEALAASVSSHAAANGAGNSNGNAAGEGNGMGMDVATGEGFGAETDTNGPGGFEMCDPTLGNINMDMGDSLFDVDMQGLFSFSGLDANIMALF
ncbi:hypothetical protein BJX70DRAFT_396958 [Aspergillus crustosus]